jgi:hypothetical protein
MRLAGWKTFYASDFPGVAWWHFLTVEFAVLKLFAFIRKISGCNTIGSVNGFLAVDTELVGFRADDIELGQVPEHIAIPVALQVCL